VELDVTAIDLSAEDQTLFGLVASEPAVQTAGEGYDLLDRRILITKGIYRTKLMGLRVTVS